jgi:cytochrome P450
MQDWAWRRHVLLPSFQPKQLVPKLLPYVVEQSTEILALFNEHASQGTALEVDNVFTDLTMNVINYYLYGRRDLNFEMVGGRSNLKVNDNRERKRGQYTKRKEMSCRMNIQN